jgi:hypothetical protein
LGENQGNIKMIEIKLSHRAKNKDMVDFYQEPESLQKLLRSGATTKMYPPMEDCHSPPSHSAFFSIHTKRLDLLPNWEKKVEDFQPAGIIKLCVGDPMEIAALAKASMVCI